MCILVTKKDSKGIKTEKNTKLSVDINATIIYNELKENIVAIKSRQWIITYYGLLLIGAIAGTWKLIDSENLIIQIIFIVILFSLPLFFIWILFDNQLNLIKYRLRYDNLRTIYSRPDIYLIAYSDDANDSYFSFDKDLKIQLFFIISLIIGSNAIIFYIASHWFFNTTALIFSLAIILLLKKNIITNLKKRKK